MPMEHGHGGRAYGGAECWLGEKVEEATSYCRRPPPLPQLVVLVEWLLLLVLVLGCSALGEMMCEWLQRRGGGLDGGGRRAAASTVMWNEYVDSSGWHGGCVCVSLCSSSESESRSSRSMVLSSTSSSSCRSLSLELRMV